MHLRTWPVTAIALIATFCAAVASQVSSAPSAQAPSAPSAPPDDLRVLDGEWVFVEDRTEGRTLEQLGPPMASKFSMSIVEGAVVLNGHGSGHRDVRIALDGSVTEVAEPSGRVARYRGAWNDGTFEYEVQFVGPADSAPGRLIRRAFRITADGLLVRVWPSPDTEWVAIYRHAADIPLPEPAMAAIGDVAWLAGAWVGTRGDGGTTSIEERWSPPLGGAMLAVSRSVRGGKMTMFEYLRIVERDGGLVYLAQPGGAKATEFVLTELVTGKGTETGGTRAVFENPRHDYPNRIVYELSAEGSLSATIGLTKGGTPRRYEWKREGG